MNRVRGALVMIGLVCAFLPFGGGAGAVLSDATLRVEKQGWFWQQAQRVHVEPPVCPDPQTGVPCPSVTQVVAPYEPDHFLVGHVSGRPDDPWDAVALFQFDLGWMVPETEVFSGELILEESNDDVTHRERRPSGNVASDRAGTKLQVCLVTNFWGPSQPGLWAEVPPIDCEKASGKGARSQSMVDGRQLPVWTFDLTKIGKAWAENPFANYGVAIVPAADATGDFQVSFHGDTRIIREDPVTRLEEVEPLTRVTARMKVDVPFIATDDEPPAGGTATGATGGSTLSVAPLPGSLGAFRPTVGAPTASLDVPEVNRTVEHRTGGPVAAAYRATTPGYALLGFPLALIIGRLLMLLFVGGGPGVRENRVAAAHRKARAIPAR